MSFTCSQIFDLITTNQPTLPAAGRLDTALQTSKLDPIPTLLAIAYKESRFNSDAVNPTSAATGLFQFVLTTADDIQVRVVKNFLPAGTKIPKVPASGSFKDYRKVPEAATFCAWAYLLDRIASRGNNLQNGITAFGDQLDAYGKSILTAVASIRKIAGATTSVPADPTKLKVTMANKSTEVIAALNEAFGY